MEYSQSSFSEIVVPKVIFIIPYRNRELQLGLFRRHMKYILEDLDPSSYKIYFIHQQDKRVFNRGALKNIGFQIMKETYPESYKNITFVFNDIDTMPYVKNFFNYETKKGNIKHFYGFEYALGGIVSINGEDFEKINGYPNFWSWGYEDNALQKRATKMKINIDRSQFYKILSGSIIHLQDGYIRLVNTHEQNRYHWSTSEGLTEISSIEHNINNDMINVTYFKTQYEVPVKNYKERDLREKEVHTVRGRQYKRQPMAMFI